MKKQLSIGLVLLLLMSLLAGCSGSKAMLAVQVSNPWMDYEDLQAAEQAAGFSFPVPLKVRHYRAEAFRVMDGKLLEVTYRNGDSVVTIRKQKGENRDLSGNYNSFSRTVIVDADIWKNIVKMEGSAMLNLISGNHCSYSVDAPNGYVGDANRVFIRYICVDPHSAA